MKSTYKLLWSLRRPFFIGAILEILIGCIYPSDIKQISPHIIIPIICAYATYFTGGIIPKLYKTPYPVSHRQKAWIPILFIFALIFIYEITSVTNNIYWYISQAESRQLNYETLYILSVKKMLAILIMAIIANAFINELITTIPIMVSIVLASLFMVDVAKNTQHDILIINIMYIISLVGLAIIPSIKRSMDSSVNTSIAGSVNSKKYSYEFIIAPTVTMIITQIVVMLIIVTSLILLYIKLIQQDVQSDKAYISLTMNVLIMIICSIRLIYQNLRIQYQRSRASGYGSIKSVLYTALGATYVLTPIVRVLGVKQGYVERCKKCGGYVYVWAPGCRHCHAGVVSTTEENIPKIKISYPLNRGMMIILIYCMMGAVISYHIEYLHKAAIITLPDKNPETTAIAAKEIYQRINDNMPGWLKEVEEYHAFVEIPERYAITVIDEKDSIRIDCAMTAQESGNGFVMYLANRVANQMRDAHPMSVQEAPYGLQMNSIFKGPMRLRNQVRFSK